MQAFFLVLALIGVSLTFGHNVFWVTFAEEHIHVRTHLGRKMVYLYKNITKCFYGERRGDLFLWIEFKGNKKVEIRVSVRLEDVIYRKDNKNRKSVKRLTNC